MQTKKALFLLVLILALWMTPFAAYAAKAPEYRLRINLSTPIRQTETTDRQKAIENLRLLLGSPNPEARTVELILHSSRGTMGRIGHSTAQLPQVESSGMPDQEFLALLAAGLVLEVPGDALRIAGAELGKPHLILVEYQGYKSSREMISIPGNWDEYFLTRAVNFALTIDSASLASRNVFTDSAGNVNMGHYQSYWGDPRPDDSLISKMFSRLVSGLIEGLWAIFGIQDPVTLFFNVDPQVIHDRYAQEVGAAEAGVLEKQKFSLYVDPAAEDTFLYMFSPREHELIEKTFDAFDRFLQIPYAVALAIVGLLLFLKGYSGEDRSAIKILLGSMLCFPLLIRAVPYVLEPLFWLNFTVVRAVGSVAETIVDPYGNPVHALTRPFVTILIGSGTALNSIGALIGTFFLFSAVGILNFQYFVRRYVIAILIIMFPIIAFMQIWPTKRPVLRMWFSELTSNLFMQSAHAITYLVFVSYVYQLQTPFIPVIAMLVTLLTISGFIRELMGCQTKTDTASNMLGLAAIFGAGKIAGNIISSTSRAKTENQKGSQTAGQSPEPPAGSPEPPAGSPQPPAGSPQPPAGSPETPAGSPEPSGGAPQTGLSTGTAKRIPAPLGTTWGLAPRFNTGAGLKRVGAGLLTGTAMAAGSIVGAAAAGTAGFGLGAMTGAKTSSLAVRGGTYAGQVGSNIADRETKINEARENYNMQREQAAIYAATGVDATPEEIMFDEEMSRQVANFNDVAGFADLQKKYKEIRTRIAVNPDMYLKDKMTYESVRKQAAQKRAELARGNANTKQRLSEPEVNNEILLTVIRPAMKGPQADPPSGSSEESEPIF